MIPVNAGAPVVLLILNEFVRQSLSTVLGSFKSFTVSEPVLVTVVVTVRLSISVTFEGPPSVSFRDGAAATHAVSPRITVDVVGRIVSETRQVGYEER